MSGTTRKLSAGIGGRLEGLALMAIAGYIAWLLITNTYWQLLNPRFQWLTASAGAGLAIVGAAQLFFSRSGTSFPRLAALCLLLALMGGTIFGGNWLEDASPAPASGLSTDFSATQAEKYIEIDGHEYTRISTPELIQLIDQSPDTVLSTAWGMRGIAVRTPELDAMGRFVLLRPFIWCCLADGVAVGFQVPWKDVTTLENGDWVQVAGKLTPADKLPSVGDKPLLDALFTAVDESHEFIPDSALGGNAVEHIETPRMPFIFNLNAAPPYNW